MRHVSRTHRGDLDWLFDRINLDKAIQLKYVNTPQQIADMLTKVSFFARALDAIDISVWCYDTSNTLLQPFFVVYASCLDGNMSNREAEMHHEQDLVY